MAKMIKCVQWILLLLAPWTAIAKSDEPIVLYDARAAALFDVKDQQARVAAWEECHVLATLQGIVNRKKPKLYILFVESQIIDGMNIDDYWLQMYRKEGKWLADRPIERITEIEKLIERYRDDIQGAVVYDPEVPATSIIASAVAGAEDVIAIRYDRRPDSLYVRLVEGGLKLPVKVWLVNPDGSSLFTGKGTIPQTDVPSSGSAKCDAHLWMKYRYMDTGKLNCAYAGYYVDAYWLKKSPLDLVSTMTLANHHTLTNHDFFVSKRAFFFDLGPWADEPATDDPQQIPGLDRWTLQQILLSANTQTKNSQMIHIGGFPSWAHKYAPYQKSRHHEVHGEWEYTFLISAYNGFQDADALQFGAMANASFWQHFPLQKEYPQKWVTHEQIKKRGYLNADGTVKFDERQFIIFYVGDYDSSSWLYQRMPDIWNDPSRGKLPLMWCISPVLDQRAGMVMDYMRKTATPNDYFAAPNSGAGYVNPGALQQGLWEGDPRPISNLPGALKVWQEHCAKYYKRWGLTVTGFIVDGFAPPMMKSHYDCYTAFSPNGIVVAKAPYFYLHADTMPVIKYGLDIQHNNPLDAADAIVADIRRKKWRRFHWYRNILKTPSWYAAVYKHIREQNDKIELLDAPTYFELLRIYMKTTPGVSVMPLEAFGMDIEYKN